MSSELRWILLIIGVAFLGALTWWELRRPRQASAASGSERPAPRDLAGEPPRSVRDPSLTLPEMRAFEPLPARTLPVAELTEVLETSTEGYAQDTGDTAAPPAPPEAAIAPEGALSGAPAASAESEPETFASLPDEEPDTAPEPPLPTPPQAAAAREVLPELPAAEAPLVEWPPDDERRIVALRLVATAPERFAGPLAAPGTGRRGLRARALRDLPQARRGASRGPVRREPQPRPGPSTPRPWTRSTTAASRCSPCCPDRCRRRRPSRSWCSTARNLNERLHGVLQDEQGTPLTPARIAQLRERLSRRAPPREADAAAARAARAARADRAARLPLLRAR